MRTDAWYNFRYWWWDISSWLCTKRIRWCKSCRETAAMAEAVDDG